MKKVKANKKEYVPGSKVPMKVLLDYFIEGNTIFDFLSAYPWIKKENVEKALQEFKKKEYPANHAF